MKKIIINECLYIFKLLSNYDDALNDRYQLQMSYG